MRSIRFAILLLMFTAFDAGAIRWSAFDSLDGLPSDDVWDLAESPDGAIWAATGSGLARFDRAMPGAVWETVAAGAYRRVAVDVDGVVWAADTLASLHRFDSNATPLGSLPEASANVVIRDLEPAEAGGVYVAWTVGAQEVGSGLARVRMDGATVRRDTLRADSRVFCVRTAADGALWWGRDARTLEFDEGSGIESILLPSISTLSRVLAVAPLTVGGAVAVLSTGEVFYAADGGRVAAVDVGPNEGRSLDDVIEDARGRILVARQDEVVVIGRQGNIDPTMWTHEVVANRSGLVAGRVLDILETGFGSVGGSAITSGRELWFASDVGIAVQSDQPWFAYRCADGTLDPQVCSRAGAEEIRAVSSAPDGSIWVGSQGGLHVVRTDGSTEGYWGRVTGGDLIVPSVRDIWIDDDGTVYVATAVITGPSIVMGGLQRYRDGVWTTIGEASPEWFVWSMERDDVGRLWLATEAGLFHLDTTVEPATLVAQDESVGLSWSPITSVATRDGEVVVSANQGLARLPNGASSWRLLTLDEQPMDACRSDDSDRILSLAVGPTSIAAAVSGGLLLVDREATTLAGTLLLGPEAIPNCTIMDIAVESDGAWLLATPTGLVRVLPGGARVGRIGPLDGLPSTEVHTIHRRDDEFWFGFSGDGVAVHRFENPETAVVRGLQPVLTDATTPRFVEVAAFDPDNQTGRLRFEIRAGGSDWVDAGSGPVLPFVPSEFGLGQGTHTVELRAIDPGALVDLSPATADFELDIDPPEPWITRPVGGDALRGRVEILGIATDLRFARYRVDIERDGDSRTITDWTNTPVADGPLGVFDTLDLEDDRWVLRLTVEDTLGVSGSSRTTVLVDNEAPFADVTSPVEVEGARGGTVASIDGAAELGLPALAFSGRATITIDRVEATEPTFDLGGLSGRLEFPATLQLRVPEGFSNASIVRVGSSSKVLGGTLSDVDGVPVLTVPIEVFGRYALRVGRPEAVDGASLFAGFDAQPRYLDPRDAGSEGHVDISFSLSRSASVRAVVYSRNGRARRVLVDGRGYDPGQHVLRWNARDHAGDVVATGLYILHLEADGESRTQVIGVGRQ